MNRATDDGQASEVTDLRAIKSREAMRAALLQLLADTPFDQITTRDITTTARVGYATFYRHYETKEALLSELATEEVNRLIALALPVLEDENPMASCVKLCSYVDEHRALWKTFLVGGAAGAIKEELMRVSREIAAGWPQAQTSLPADLGISLIVSATVELLVWWLSQEDPRPIEEVADIYHRMIVAPAVASG